MFRSNAEKCYVSAMGLNEEDPLIPLNYSAFAYQNVSGERPPPPLLDMQLEQLYLATFVMKLTSEIQ